jgi:hypothetical protein
MHCQELRFVFRKTARAVSRSQAILINAARSLGPIASSSFSASHTVGRDVRRKSFAHLCKRLSKLKRAFDPLGTTLLGARIGSADAGRQPIENYLGMIDHIRALCLSFPYAASFIASDGTAGFGSSFFTAS